MNNRFNNQRDLTRRLRQLLVLFVLLLMPLGSWAQGQVIYYPISIGGTPLTSENENTGAFSGVTYDDNASTLSLDNVSNLGQIIWWGATNGTFTIHFKGTNTIIENSSSDAIIPANGYDNVTLVLEGEMVGDINSTLKINGTVTPIKNFASVTLSGAYLSSDIAFYYGESQSGSGEKMYFSWNHTQDPFEVEFTTEVKYPLWINGKQVTAANSTNVLSNTHNNKVAFSAGTANILELKGLIIDGNGIFCGLDNLTIDLQGENVLQSNDALCLIKSCNESAPLTFTTSGTTEPKLTLTNKDTNADDPSVIEGFASVTIPTDLSWTDNSTTPHNVSYNNSTLKLVTDFSKDPIAHNVNLAPTAYPLTVGGTQVNTFNAGDVFGDGTVSFVPASSANGNVNTLTLNNINAGTTIYNGNYIESNLQKLNVDLLGENNIGCTGAAIYNNYNGASLHFKSTDTYSGNLYVLNGGTVYNGFLDANVSFDTELIYNATSNSIVTQFYELWVGHEDQLVTIKNKDDIKPPYGITLGTDGKVSYDPDNHVLTLKNATIEGCGIRWDEAANLTIKLIGTNFINTTGDATISSIRASGVTAAAPSLTFEQGDNSNNCSLVINCATGKNVINGFSSSNDPTMGAGLSWVVEEEDANNYITKATVGIYYGLSVGGKVVTNVNALDVLEDGNVSYDKASNTLTLQNGTTLNDAIWYDSNLPNQTIVLNGIISVANTSRTYAVYSNSGNITFEKGTGVTNAELTATCGPGYNPIERNSISLGDGLYWKPLAPGATSNTTVITDKPGFILVEGSLFADGQTFNGTTGTITYNENDKTLTFTNYSGDFTSSNAIETGIEGLKIKLVGDNVITFENTPGDVAFKGIQPNASIQFIKEGNATMTITDVTKAIDGFTAGNVTYENLICYESGNSEWSIRKISKPQLSAAVNGTDNFTYATIDYDPADKSATSNEVVYASLSPKLKYSFDYADANLSDITGADYPNGGIKMTSPGVLTAWVEVGTVKSEEVTGVRFGLTEDVIKTLYDGAGQQTISMNLEPAGRLSDVDISLLNNPTWVTSFNQSTKELTVTGCGMSNFSLSFNLNKTATSSFAVLGDDGDNVKFAIEVLPPAPTIAFDANKTYLSTDEIEITGINNTTIFYTWGDAVIGKNYTHSADVATLMEYNGTGVPAQTGTLRTWAGYLLSGNTYVLSEVASQAFTVKKDIASCTVTLPTRATYTGDAYEPVVYETATSTSPLTLGTDYTVSYKKTDGETATDVGSMVDAGIYKITITGKGDFGGTKDITRFQIGQAGNNLTTTPAAAGKLTYTGEAQALVTAGVAAFGDVQYKLGADGTYSTTIPTATDAKDYTVYYKVEATDNYAGIAEASVNVTIEKATPTITKAPVAKTLTYTGAALALVEAGTVSAGTIVYSKTLTGTFTEAIPEETNAGSYTVYYKVNGNDNYNGIDASETNKVSVTINPKSIADVDITLKFGNTETSNVIFTGENQKPTVIVKDGDAVLVLDNDYTLTNEGGTNVGEYSVTVTGKGNYNGEASTKFRIISRTATAAMLGLSDSQPIATFYTGDEDLYLPNDIVAYIITGISDNTVLVKRISFIPKGVPVLVELGTSTETAVDAADGNQLKYAIDPVDVTGKEYVLYKNEFVKATGTITGKGYLEVTGGSAARRLSIAHGGSEVAGINDVTLDEDSENEQWYDLQGRKIEKPTKTGIYIVNGKKKVINIK